MGRGWPPMRSPSTLMYEYASKCVTGTTSLEMRQPPLHFRSWVKILAPVISWRQSTETRRHAGVGTNGKGAPSPRVGRCIVCVKESHAPLFGSTRVSNSLATDDHTPRIVTYRNPYPSLLSSLRLSSPFP